MREAAKARLQASKAASLVDAVPGMYRVDSALQLLQLDHTPVGVVVVVEAHRLPIGKPWLPVAIEVATRGWTGRSP